MNLVPYMRSLQKLDVTFTVTFRLERVSRDRQELIAVVSTSCSASGMPSPPATRMRPFTMH